MDTSATAADGQRISSDDIAQSRIHYLSLAQDAAEFAETNHYAPLINNACDAVEQLDKITEILIDSENLDLAHECTVYAQACALGAHFFVDGSKGITQGLGDTAHDCAHATAHPVQTAQAFVQANIEFGQLLFELGKLCVDPSLTGHRLETAQQMAAALGHAIEEKVDHMQHATLQENVRALTHLVATAHISGKAQALSAQQLRKLIKYVAKLKNIIAAEKQVTLSLGTAPIIENALEKAAPKAAQQLGRAAEFEIKIFRLPPGERVAVIRTEAEAIANSRGWEKVPSKISRSNGNRIIYADKATKRFYSVDTQHGRFEMCNKNGIHLGEVDFDLNATKGPDLSGGHNLQMP